VRRDEMPRMLHCRSAEAAAILLRPGGAEIDRADEDGLTALMVVCQFSAPAAQALLERGASADRSDHMGRTPLHWAVLHRKHEVVRELLEAGAWSVVDQPMKGGASPLSLAKDSCCFCMASLMMEDRLARSTVSA